MTMRLDSASLRKVVARAVAGATLLVAASVASAQSFPSRPVRIIVPYAPGGAAEAVARLVADQLAVALKQPVLIDNRPGGGTVVGANVAMQAPADGHTIFVNASSYLINAHLMKSLPYDTWKDFVPVTLLASNPHVLVAHTGTGWKSVQEFLAAARAKGPSFSYASFGNGSSGHLAFEMLKTTYRFDMVHVPYKSTPQAMTDVMGGAVQTMLTDMPAAVQQVRAGRLVALAIAAEQRSPMLADVPTFAEATGTKFLSRSWWGFMVKSGTPPEIVKTLETETIRALGKPEVRGKLAEVGIDAIGSSATEFAAFMRTEHERFGAAIKASGATLD